MRSMLGSRLIADRIDDDMIRRLIHGIEELADSIAGEHGHDKGRENVEWAMDGDLFLAYRGVRAMMAEHYPETAE